MGRTTKVSISVPETRLREVEQRRGGSKETRSDFFRRAAESLLRSEREQEAVARYVQGYRDHPESTDEEDWARLGETRLAEAEW